VANGIGFLSLGELINIPLLDFNISNITGLFKLSAIFCNLYHYLWPRIWSFISYF